MHELGIAHSILDTVLEKAREHNANKIIRVELAFGEKAGIVKESMEFIWEVITSNTIAEGSQLNITIIPLEAQCQHCGKRFILYALDEQCPRCGKDEMTIEQGLDELKIISLDID